MPLVEAAFAFALVVATAGALLLAIWTVMIRRRKEIYIAPFHVAGEDADSAIGVALANMLRARLVQAQREADLRAILSSSGAEDPAATLAAPLVTATVAQLRGAVEPVNIDFSVGKVSVGGLLAWAQRWALERQTLRLTVVFTGNAATVSGTLEPFGLARARALWSITAPDPEVIVDAAADAIMQSRAADDDPDGAQAATALEASEFGDLVWSLNQLALHERRTKFGQSSAGGTGTLRAVHERVLRLTETFPRWNDLARFADDIERRLAFETAPPQETEQAAAQPGDEVAFLAEIDSIHDRLFADNERPDIVISEGMTGGIMALWNSDEHRYEVNAANIGDPGFAADVALMGRLMMKNFDRCGGQFDDVSLWNDYRNGVVAYLAETVLDAPAAWNEWLRQGVFFRWLQRLQARDDVPALAAGKLALLLVDSYDCEWTWQSVRAGVVRLNEEGGSPVPREALAKAVRGLRPARG